MNPEKGFPGQTLNVSIVGARTHFTQGSSVARFGSPADIITVNSTTVKDATHATANITIAMGARIDWYDVNVATGFETPDPLSDGFYVGPIIQSVSPTSGKAGKTLNVSIVGYGTHFVNGISVADFEGKDRGVKVNSTKVKDATHATANITIAAGATAGYRTVNVVTDTENPYPLFKKFYVDGPFISSVNPVSGAPGQTLTVSIVGYNTHFAKGISVADFGDGIMVQSTKVTDKTHAKANIKIASGKGTWSGYRDVNVVTGAETPGPLVKGFCVGPMIKSVSPNSGFRGQTLNVSIVGEGTHFKKGTSVASFLEPTGERTTGIKVNSTTVKDATHATANITVALCAPKGWRYVNVTTGTEVSGYENTFALKNGFQVTAEVPTPVWYLADGSSAWGFTALICIQNPNATKVTAKITFMLVGGKNVVKSVSLPANSQTTLNAGDVLGEKDFSTKVECTEGKTIAVDRRMMWTGPGAASPEGHSSIGVTAPAKTWYLAEGSSQWNF